MDLREYLFHKRMTYTDFAKEINYDKFYINAIALGKRRPGIKLARAIEIATNGEVKAIDLMKIDPKKKII